uniref:potassium voltage-gated channel subfamily A member 7-like n=1 Tax=Myxine glutinosa TaxID=7769 RepID=UPI00358E668B
MLIDEWKCPNRLLLSRARFALISGRHSHELDGTPWSHVSKLDPDHVTMPIVQHHRKCKETPNDEQITNPKVQRQSMHGHVDTAEKMHVVVDMTLERDAPPPKKNHENCNGGLEETTASERIAINVSGLHFETAERTLARFPDTLLGDRIRRRIFYDSIHNELFFDHHRDTFSSILFYYQSGGVLKRPVNVPLVIFCKELEFFDLGEGAMRTFLEEEGLSVSKELPPPCNTWQYHFWLHLERPESSLTAFCVSTVSLAFILISITTFLLGTVPSMRINNLNNSSFTNAGDYPDFTDPIFILETLCIIWFILELVCRFACSVDKQKLFYQVITWIDLAVILSYMVELFIDLSMTVENEKTSYLSFLRFVSLLRVLRVLKLARYFRGLRVLGKTLKSSYQELCILVVFLFVGVVIFASAIHYTEADVRETHLKSIPESFWWAVVTMTTVGYGDITPVTPAGKLVGSLCAITGIVVVALPIPFVVNRFQLFYELDNVSGHETSSKTGYFTLLKHSLSAFALPLTQWIFPQKD